MWMRKSEKDRQEDRCTPIPTQVVSNEEYIPMPQSEDQRRVERRIYELADRLGARRKMSRRQHLRSPWTKPPSGSCAPHGSSTRCCSSAIRK